MGIAANIQKLKEEIGENVKLLAVSKTHPVDFILEAYQSGHRCFGENKVQELCSKQALLPADIEWHLIGHLQSNKVKYIAPFVSMIHSVDSQKLLEVINKEALKNNRTIDCLLQVHIAKEETKFGLNELELIDLIQVIQQDKYDNVRIRGLMGMATLTNDESVIECEFEYLKKQFISLKENQCKSNPFFDTLSMGMSSDYPLAIKHGSNLIRVGSTIFGHR